MKKRKRSAKIIHALLELGSFGPVDKVEDTHEQAEKFLDEHSPGWRDMELIESKRLEQYKRAVLCLMRETRAKSGVYGNFEDSSPGPSTRQLLAEMGLLIDKQDGSYDFTPAAHELAEELR